MLMRQKASFAVIIAFFACTDYSEADEKKENSKPAPGHTHAGELLMRGQGRPQLQLMGQVM